MRPASPSRAGWVLDPWGDGERFWDGEIWTGQTRDSGAADMAAAAEEHQAPIVELPAADGPRDWHELDEVEDDRPFRSGLLRGMIWAFAVVAIIAMLLTAVSIWPMLLRGIPSDREVTVVPQQSAQAVCAVCYT